jgi:hypothetical protein
MSSQYLSKDKSRYACAREELVCEAAFWGSHVKLYSTPISRRDIQAEWRRAMQKSSDGFFRLVADDRVVAAAGDRSPQIVDIVGKRNRAFDHGFAGDRPGAAQQASKRRRNGDEG